MSELLPIIDARYRGSRLAPVVAWLGTSSVAYASQYDAATRIYNWASDKNYVGWSAVLCPQVRMMRAAVQGFGGQTSSQMLSVGVPALLALPYVPALTLVMVPQNDAGVLTFEDSCRNVVAIVEALLARGGRVGIIIQHPRAGTQTDASARVYALRQNRFAEWMQWTYPGLLWANVGRYVADRTVSGQYAYKADLLSDGIHLNDLGAFLVARDVFKPIIDKVIPTDWSGVALSDADTYNVNNPYGSITVNPTMLGTTGTVGSGVAAGQVATGYTINSFATGVTVTPSKLTENGRVWQRLLITGTPTTQGHIEINPSVVAGALASMPGHDYELEIEYRIVAGPGGSVLGAGPVRSRFARNEGGVQWNNRCQATVDTAFVAVPHAHQGVLRTLPARIVGAVSNITDTRLYCQVPAALPAQEFYLDVGAFILHRIPALSDITA